jgi:hypothetical protein
LLLGSDNENVGDEPEICNRECVDVEMRYRILDRRMQNGEEKEKV